MNTYIATLYKADENTAGVISTDFNSFARAVTERLGTGWTIGTVTTIKD